MSIIEQISSIVGADNVRTTAEDKAPYLSEPRGAWHGKALLVALPARVEEVAAIVKLAVAQKLHIVPQGGGTGLVGAQIAFDEQNALVLNLSRLNKIRAHDASTLTAEAGCVLASIHEAAAKHKRQFPLRLASEGSAQLGGLLATNAGGHHVLRYGMMRALTLGLEAVLADGSIWHGLKTIPKDNSGYDLKNLLIGSEGTLAIITAATLRLFPLDKHSTTALVALDSIAAAAVLFQRAEEFAFGQISAFELIADRGIAFMLRHNEGARLPFERHSPYYVLIESAAPEGVLEEILIGENAVIAQSQTQAKALWFFA